MEYLFILQLLSTHLLYVLLDFKKGWIVLACFLLRMLGALILSKIKMPSRLITDMGQLFVAFYPYETGVWVGKSPRGKGRTW